MPKKPKSTPAITRPAIAPYPCGCGGVLVPIDAHGLIVNLERDDATAWRCCSPGGGAGCGTVIAARGELERERCPNDGAPLRFDSSIVGQTVGGLRLRGWMHCDHCGASWVTRRGVPDAGGGTSDGRWRVANGGASLDAGGIRLRAEGRGNRDEVVTTMARIARMPVLEAALEELASGTATSLERVIAIARAALEAGENVEAGGGDQLDAP
jgi:hypothetical protein